VKAYKILLFLVALFLVLGAACVVWPEDDVHLGSLTLRFPSLQRALNDTTSEQIAPFELDSLLKKLSEDPFDGFDEGDYDFVDGFNPRTRRDTMMGRYGIYSTTDPYRIFLPGDDYTYFDNLFARMEQAEKTDTLVRVMHYGDSQIELDRISSVLRQRLQERFGGSGPGMVPVVQPVATTSVSQSFDGDWTRYTMYGDSTTMRAPHNRYGVMAQMSEVHGRGYFSFRTAVKNSRNVRRITKVSALVGNTSAGFSAALRIDTSLVESFTLDSAKSGVSLLSWSLNRAVQRGTIAFTGDGDVYGILLDGDNGVTVDNDALRGCSGTIFGRITSSVLKESFELLNTGMIILQFGGNAMPVIHNQEDIDEFAEGLRKQIAYFKRVAPEATILFIGPSDMGKSVNGRMQSWPLLKETNDALRNMALSNGVAYWDLYSTMGGAGSMISWVDHDPALASPDYIHFTSKGAERVGDALSKSLLTYYDFYRLRKSTPEDGEMGDAVSSGNIDSYMDSIIAARSALQIGAEQTKEEEESL